MQTSTWEKFVIRVWRFKLNSTQRRNSIPACLVRGAGSVFLPEAETKETELVRRTHTPSLHPESNLSRCLWKVWEVSLRSLTSDFSQKGEDPGGPDWRKWQPWRRNQAFPWTPAALPSPPISPPDCLPARDPWVGTDPSNCESQIDAS